MCLAGWAAELAGGKWAYSSANHLLAEPGDNLNHLLSGVQIHVEDRATRLLELTEEQADNLFCAGNTLADIKAVRNQIAAERAS